MRIFLRFVTQRSRRFAEDAEVFLRVCFFLTEGNGENEEEGFVFAENRKLKTHDFSDLGYGCNGFYP